MIYFLTRTSNHNFTHRISRTPRNHSNIILKYSLETMPDIRSFFGGLGGSRKNVYLPPISTDEQTKLTRQLYVQLSMASLSGMKCDFSEKRAKLANSKLTRKGFTGIKTAPFLKPVDDSAKIIETATVLFKASAPQAVDEYILSFKAHPDVLVEKNRLLETADWCKNAEDYIEVHARLQFHAMMSMQSKVRHSRERIEETLRDQASADIRNSLRHDMDVHVETSLLLRTNRIPEVLVDIIFSYIPTDMLFRVSMPSVSDMEGTLAKAKLSHVKHLNKIITDKYSGIGRDESIYRIFGAANKDKVIPTTYVPPTCYGWGHSKPAVKAQFVENVVAYVQAYDHFYKIFMKVAETATEPVRRATYAKHATRFRKEITYIIKFINLLAKLNTKTKKSKTPAK